MKLIYSKYRFYFVVALLIIALFIIPNVPYVNLYSKYLWDIVPGIIIAILFRFNYKVLFGISLFFLILMAFLAIGSKQGNVEQIGNWVFILLAIATGVAISKLIK